MRWRVALTSLMHSKLLRVQLHSASAGELINLASNDIERLQKARTLMPLYPLPPLFCLSCYLLSVLLTL